ncbi:hypothetical protein B1748_23685 [Paenibacillus sp. MY03]|nr:hypothetical protein B1748_23685 [Paenibacillus sp. MY03]
MSKMTQREYRGKRIDNEQWIVGWYSELRFTKPFEDKVTTWSYIDDPCGVKIPVDPDTVGQ